MPFKSRCEKIKATWCSGQASDSSYNIAHMTLLTSIVDPH